MGMLNSLIVNLVVALPLTLVPSCGQPSTSRQGCTFADDQYVYNVELLPEARDLVCPTHEVLLQTAGTTINHVSELQGMITKLKETVRNLQHLNSELLLNIQSTERELDATKQAVAAKLGLLECPPGYHVHNEEAKSCYQFIGHYLDWYTAEGYCMSTGGHLVALETAGEQDFLATYATQHSVLPGKHLWTGGNDISQENVWMWTGINQEFNYTNWLLYPHNEHGPIQMPDNHLGIEHCIHLFHLHDYQWNDLFCRNQHYFVCEYKLI